MPPTDTKAYTPGPWRMGTHTSDGFCVAPEWDWPTHRGEGRIIANHLLSEADARLIAAAPEMLEALKVCVEAIKFANSNSSGLWGARTLAESLIAKVEGR